MSFALCTPALTRTGAVDFVDGGSRMTGGGATVPLAEISMTAFAPGPTVCELSSRLGSFHDTGPRIDALESCVRGSDEGTNGRGNEVPLGAWRKICTGTGGG